jgi:hypothetical protein
MIDDEVIFELLAQLDALQARVDRLEGKEAPPPPPPDLLHQQNSRGFTLDFSFRLAARKIADKTPGWSWDRWFQLTQRGFKVSRAELFHLISNTPHLRAAVLADPNNSYSTWATVDAELREHLSK